MSTQYPIKTSFVAGEWSPRMYGRSDLETYSNAARTIENFTILPQGGLERRGGSRFIGQVKAGSSRLVKFEFSVTQAYLLEFTDLTIRIYKNSGIIESSPTVPLEVVTPYLEAELSELNFTQSADILYIVHPDHPPSKLSRTSDTAWAFSAIDFIPPAFETINDTTSLTITASALTGTGITLTASSSLFVASDATNYIQLSENLASRFSLWKETKAVTIGNYRYYNDNLYISATTATTGEDPPVHLEGTESDGVVDWTYVNSGFGIVKLTGYTSDLIVTGDVIIDLPSGYTTGYHKFAKSKWSVANGYPKTVTFFEERLWFGGNANFPQTLWASVTGDFENFTRGTDDDNSLEYTISSDQVNTIQWISPGKILAVGTSGGEFVVSASSADESITPTNIKISIQSTYGSSSVDPIRIADAVLFLQRTGRKLREFQFNFQSDSYIAPDLSILAEHITSSGVIALYYQREPNDVVYCVRADGQLISFTYLRSQEVNGWSRNILGGVSDAIGTAAVVESVCILPAPSGTFDDEVYVSVKRYINGVTVRYIELIKTGLLTDDAADSIYLDSSLSYDGSPVSSVSGLSHLEGETVSILANGATHPDVVVTSGAVTLTRTASKIHIGYNYTSKLETLNIEAGVSAGNSAQGKIKRISSIVVRLLNTVGLKIGSSDTNLDPVSFRDSSMSMDSGIPLFSGDKKTLFRSSSNTDGRIVIVQDDPLPCTILALMPKVNTEVN